MSPSLPAVDVIVPTYDNAGQLREMIESIHDTYESLRIIVVNNGSTKLEPLLPQTKKIVIVNTEGKNLGWEGGLALGLQHVTADYVLFANDDIYVPVSSRDWLRTMVADLVENPSVGAIGPSSNVVMLWQSIWSPPFIPRFEVGCLVGFCMLIRRAALEKAGGVDAQLGSGDDLDLSIRLQDAGYRLVVRKDVYVHHHGFQTGIRLFGGPQKPGGWNSPDMIQRTREKIIAKHGVNAWKILFAEPSTGERVRARHEDVTGDLRVGSPSET